MNEQKELHNIAVELHNLNGTMNALLQEMRQIKVWVAQSATAKKAA